MKIRVASNLSRLRTVTLRDVDLRVLEWPSKRNLWVTISMFFRSFNCNYIVLNGAPNTLFILALLKLFIPFHRSRIVALDILVSRPHGLASRIKTRLRGLLLRRVHRILLYYKRTRDIEACLGLPRSKFDYIPFKINEYSLVRATVPSDQGYIFCGGKTRRDFATLIEAVRGLPYPVKIVTTSNEDIARHGSFLDESVRWPPRALSYYHSSLTSAA
jgi:hypothetical protein